MQLNVFQRVLRPVLSVVRCRPPAVLTHVAAAAAAASCSFQMKGICCIEPFSRKIQTVASRQPKAKKIVVKLPVNVEEDKSLTPGMMNYLSIKKKYSNFLLLYQIGDFFQMFNEDAVRGAALLDIALTKKRDVPMCGVPVHSLDNYLDRLVKKGVMVAVCEQMRNDSPSKTRSIKREVTRLVTPGTLIEDKFLETRKHNYLLAISKHAAGGAVGASRSTTTPIMGIAWVDLSTGEFHTSSCEVNLLSSHLSRLSPKEILLSPSLIEDAAVMSCLKEYPYHQTIWEEEHFSENKGTLAFKHYFGGNVGVTFSKDEIRASNALLDYIKYTQRGKLPQFSPPQRFSARESMFVDTATRRSLELTVTQTGEKKGSVLDEIDKTVTPMGARYLEKQFSCPLLSPHSINARLDFVEFFFKYSPLREKIQGILRHCHDLERCLQRLALGRGGPNDLTAIEATLALLGTFTEAFRNHQLVYKKADPTDCALPHLLKDCLDKFELCHSSSQLKAAIDRLHKAIDKTQNPFTPPTPSTGLAGVRLVGASLAGFIAPGYCPQLDEQRKLKNNGQQILEELTDQYRLKYGLPFRLRNSKSTGYVVTLPISFVGLVDRNYFKHSKGIKGTYCFKTIDILELELKVERSEFAVQKREEEIFNELASEVMKVGVEIKLIADALAQIDVSAGLATKAHQGGYCRPKIFDTGRVFEVEGGRHVTVESIQPNFVPNDCYFNDNLGIWLVTGANMGGKSTFLRQNALIAILAQMGSFVPAKAARVSVIDAVFSRVGASDDLAHNRSTFMVEMLETSFILAYASPKSLVIMDEIGRGTATADGLAIAQAVVERLHNVNKCRTLFATHFHELTHLERSLPHLKCFHLATQQTKDVPIFIHKIIPGAASRSYGIQVAQLAGMDPSVIQRAFDLLNQKPHIEEQQQRSLNQHHIETMKSILKQMDLAKTTPFEAHRTLLEMKKILHTE